MENDDKKISYLDSAEKSAQWFSSLGEIQRLAFDLEADGLYSYEDKICLAQVACEGRIALIDPLADKEALAPLAKVLADSAIEKIAHGADYDVRLIKKDLAITPANLFDTMIAAQMTGCERVGLAALMEENFGLAMDKKHQRADWTKRPLSQSMIDYAACDVERLEELAGIMKARLTEKGRERWAEEEFRLLEKAEPPGPRKPWCLDVKGSHKLAPRQLGVLQALLDLREEAARKRDRPPFKILSNQTLVEWALNPPKTRLAVINSEGVSKPAMERMASAILEAVERALELPAEELPQRPTGRLKAPLTPEEQKKLEKLKEARAASSKTLGIDPGLLVNTATLEKFARSSLGEERAKCLAELKGWQREAVGGELSAALDG